MATTTDELDGLCVNTIRTLSMDAVQKANSGHPGTPMALAPIAHLLYGRLMRHDPARPDWPDRDRFVLSAGHASMLLYSVLHLAGYGLTLEDLRHFRQLGWPTAGHPEYGHAAGIETTTGPLGQGIANAVGLALAERMLAARFNRDGHTPVDHRTYAIVSDGDLQEGVASEACSLAGHLRLGRLITFYDDNHISIEGDTALSFSEDVPRRFEAYGWHVQDLGEDLALDRLQAAVEEAAQQVDRPSLIVVRTHIAPGSPNKQDTHGAHGAPLGEDEVRLTKEAYGWPADEHFLVPDAVREYYERAAERGARASAGWDDRLGAYRDAHPELAAEFERSVVRRELPPDWDAEIPRPDAGLKPLATRKASQNALQWVAGQVPELVGGSADLGPSTLTDIADGGSVGPGSYAGRILHFGIREHAMGAIVNGLTLHGLRAFGATFLIFSDYMKPSVRLAAVMGIGSIFVYTHDSIGVGEDGPTHQPVEQLAGLRAIPNLHVVRPADSNETVLAWRHAVNRTSGPTLMAFSRQGAPTLDPATVPDDAVERGAYVLRDAEHGEPETILIATGTEVGLALETADLLGPATRVVSMPCMEAFSEQDEGYRDAVLPPAVRARVAIEAAGPMPWYRWVGEHGEIVAMEGYGASGPAPDLYKHFGFTAERIAERARALAARV